MTRLPPYDASGAKFPIRKTKLLVKISRPTGSSGGPAASDRLGFSKMVSGPPKGTKVSFTSMDAPRSDMGPVRVLLPDRSEYKRQEKVGEGQNAGCERDFMLASKTDHVVKGLTPAGSVSCHLPIPTLPSRPYCAGTRTNAVRGARSSVGGGSLTSTNARALGCSCSSARERRSRARTSAPPCSTSCS